MGRFEDLSPDGAEISCRAVDRRLNAKFHPIVAGVGCGPKTKFYEIWGNKRPKRRILWAVHTKFSGFVGRTMADPILNLVEFAQGVLKLREFNLWGAFFPKFATPLAAKLYVGFKFGTPQ